MRAAWRHCAAFAVCIWLCMSPWLYAQPQLSPNPGGYYPAYYPAGNAFASAVSWESSHSMLEQRLYELEQAVKDQKQSASNSNSKPTQKWTGRIHADYWGFPGDDEGTNFFESGDVTEEVADRFLFRRLRLGMAGNVNETMEYKIEFDFAEANDLAIKDAYLGWNDLPILHTLLLGYQKRPYGLDHLNSSRYNVFLERPFVIEAFNPDARRFGLCSYGLSDDLAYNWRLGTYVTTDMQDTGIYVAEDGYYQCELAGRLANTIWYDESSDGRGYAHWAISGTHADTNGNLGPDSTARFRTRPEARTSGRWLDTGVMLGADTYQLLGVEGVVNVGTVQCVGELMHAWVQRKNGFDDVRLYGGYLYLSYFLTGEHMPWERESGTLARVKPFENFFLVNRCDGGLGHGWGAWQVAIRYSYGDFTDEDILGGVGTSVTCGLNWWWNPYSRLQLNYIYGDIDSRYPQRLSSTTALPAGPAGPGAGDYHVIGARFAVDF